VTIEASAKLDRALRCLRVAQPSTGVAGMAGMSGGSGNGVAGMSALGLGNPPPVVQRAAPKPTGPVRVSSGTVAGLAISQPQPTYPAIARAAHVQGTVVLHAIISKQGTIQQLKVVSGPPMLTASAMDAVSRWKYKPYLLNGEPVEVETTINVNFTFGG